MLIIVREIVGEGTDAEGQLFFPSSPISVERFLKELSALNSKNDSTLDYAKSITLWIKDNLGTKLEHVDVSLLSFPAPQPVPTPPDSSSIFY